MLHCILCNKVNKLQSYNEIYKSHIQLVLRKYLAYLFSSSRTFLRILFLCMQLIILNRYWPIINICWVWGLTKIPQMNTWEYCGLCFLYSQPRFEGWANFHPRILASELSQQNGMTNMRALEDLLDLTGQVATPDSLLLPAWATATRI